MLRPTPVTALVKFGCMLGTPPVSHTTRTEMRSENVLGDADNQQGSRLADKAGLTPQRLHAELLAASISVSHAYLLGALHDATISKLHGTVRFGQSDVGWLSGVATLCRAIGQRSWMYREGKTRNLWILETSARWLTSETSLTSSEERLAYARGYFDTEGGVPHNPAARFYIQLVQKNAADISKLKAMLEELGIACGKLHNPSAGVDAELWRFYVSARSHRAFVEHVSSWHPQKRRRLELWLESQDARMKI
jgi:hypothetical protein